MKRTRSEGQLCGIGSITVDLRSAEAAKGNRFRCWQPPNNMAASSADHLAYHRPPRDLRNYCGIADNTIVSCSD